MPRSDRAARSEKPARVIDLPESLPPLPRAYIPEPAPLPPGSRMPMARNELFVGREDQLHELAEALQTHGMVAIGQVASVTSLGGIGKTQLAAEFVYRYGQFFTGGVFWLGFADPASVRTEIALCGGPEHLNLWSLEGAPDIDTQVATIRRIFAGPEPRLLVFDNCEDEELLAKWRPATGGSRVLVTSRLPAFSPYLGVRTFPLDVLPRAESLALVRSLNRSPASDAADEATLDAICAEVGDLPLALHLAGSFLTCYRHAITPAAYLAQLRSPALLEHPPLKGRGTAISPTKHELHVSRTFELSWEQLNPASAVDALARGLLQRAACLAPGEPIPHVLLLATLGVSGDDLDAKLARADALRRLLDLGLLDEHSSGSCRIHRMVAAFAWQTGGEHSASRTALEQALLDEVRRVNDSGLPAQLLPWQPHLRVVTDAARARDDEQAADLCAALGAHLHAIGNYQAARPYKEHALAIREKQLGPEHPDTAQSLSSLARLREDLGAHAEARPLYERALAIFEKQLGPEHPLTATILNNLAGLLWAQGAHAKALPLYERALTILEKQLGPEHPLTAASLNNLAALLEGPGALAKARPLLSIWPKWANGVASWIILFGLLVWASGELDLPRSGDNIRALGTEIWTDKTVSEAEFHSIAYWSDVLQRYPDLHSKVRAILDEADRAERRQFPGEKVEVRFYDSDRATQVKAQTVDVVITDLDRVSLRRLLAMWDQVPARAKQLGLEGVSLRAEPADHHRVVILGSDATVKVKGPSGSSQQTIKIFSYGGAAPSRVTIHAFGQRGADAQASLPFKNFIRSNRTGVPPPRNKVTILTAGNLRALDIEGPSGYAQQSVEFKIFVEENMEPARYTEESYKRAEAAVRSVVEAAAIRASKNGRRGPAGRPSSWGSGPRGGSTGGARFGIRR
jgi:tetratricopeptide (TPR) repeat protein